MEKYDVIIVGAGAAGLTSAIYAARRELKTLVLSSDLGGQAAIAWEIENYPGSNEPKGTKLMKKFEEQAKKFGANFEYDCVNNIEKKNGGFLIKTAQKEYNSRAIILAYGKSPRKLGLENEEKFEGKGIAYCATCDAPLFKDKTVAVVGGGNSAFDAAILLAKNITKNDKKVYLIHRRDQFRAEEYRVVTFKEMPHTEILLNSEIKELKGNDFLQSAVVVNNKTKKKIKLKIEGLFVEIGFDVDPRLANNLGIDLDGKNQIIIDNSGQTSVEGVFAAGDVTNTPYKQIVISAGEGAKAALSSFEYLQGRKLQADWGKGNK